MWFTSDWFAYFLFGYWILRLELQRFAIGSLVLAVVAYVATGWVTASHRELGVYDLGLNMVVPCGSLFALSLSLPLGRLGEPGSRFARVVTHLSTRSYGLYLIHGLVITEVLTWGRLPAWHEHFTGNTLKLVGLTLLGSYVAAVIIDFVLVGPIEYLFSKATRPAH